MQLILLVVVALLWVTALVTQRDLLSPGKFYLLTATVFFSGIFVEPTTVEIYAAYISILLVAAFALVLDAQNGAAEKGGSGHSHNRSRGSIVVVWALSAAAVGAQLVLIARFGGIGGYINNIGLRLVEMRGVGHFRVIISMMSFLNAYYLSIMFSRRTRRYQWIFYGVHLLLALLLALLSGSRGAVVWLLIYAGGIYHFQVRRLSISRAAAMVGAVIVIGIVLGIARQGYSWSDKGLRTGFATAGGEVQAGFLRYGLIPLELVFQRPPRDPQYGLTFAAAITNFVPRSIWPEKPSTGGVVLTEDYTGNAWGGSSYLSTGLIAEGVVNFGHPGVIVGFLLLVLVVAGNAKFYSVVRRIRPAQQGAAFAFVAYMMVVVASNALLYGEFAATGVKLITKLVMAYFCYIAIFRSRLFRRRSDTAGVEGNHAPNESPA